MKVTCQQFSPNSNGPVLFTSAYAECAGKPRRELSFGKGRKFLARRWERRASVPCTIT